MQSQLILQSKVIGNIYKITLVENFNLINGDDIRISQGIVS